MGGNIRSRDTPDSRRRCAGVAATSIAAATNASWGRSCDFFFGFVLTIENSESAIGSEADALTPSVHRLPGVLSASQCSITTGRSSATASGAEAGRGLRWRVELESVPEDFSEMLGYFICRPRLPVSVRH